MTMNQSSGSSCTLSMSHVSTQATLRVQQHEFSSVYFPAEGVSASQGLPGSSHRELGMSFQGNAVRPTSVLNAALGRPPRLVSSSAALISIIDDVLSIVGQDDFDF